MVYGPRFVVEKYFEEPAMVVVSLCSVVEDNFYWRFIASLFEKTPLLPWTLGDPIFPS